MYNSNRGWHNSTNGVFIELNCNANIPPKTKDDIMKKVTLNLQRNLAHGTLMWIYASDKKVYHSSKRFDAVEFTEHDSNFLGELEKIRPNKVKDRTTLSRLLKGSDRIYGICLNENFDQISPYKDSGEVEVIFFPNWEQLISYAETDFKEPDYEEIQRKYDAKQLWLEKGRLYLQKENLRKKEA